MTMALRMERAAPDAGQVLDEAQAMVAAGRIFDAIAHATEQNRLLRDPVLERQLVVWRGEAFARLPAPAPRPDWPPVFADPFPDVAGLPSVAAEAITPELVGGAIQHHGALWVRGLMTAGDAERLRADIDRAFAGRDAFHAGTPAEETSLWYAQAPMDETLSRARDWVESAGGAWTADSPRVLFDLVDTFQTSGIIDVITGILGERPALSKGKSTLRRVPHDSNTDWHQDGAFLGAHVRTINCWLSLSECGIDAPGLDVVARRLPYVMQTGSHGAHFQWSVGQGLIDVLEQGGAEVTSPVFAPGDALLFDQLMLHRTGVRAGMTKSRWAVESWFFAPSTFPMDQEPLVI